MNNARNWPGQVAELALAAASVDAFHNALLATTAQQCAALGGGLFCVRGDGTVGGSTSLGSGGELNTALARHCLQMTRAELLTALNGQTLTYEELLTSSSSTELCPLRLCLQRAQAAGFVVQFWPGPARSYRVFALLARADEAFTSFAERARPMLDACIPVIALAERLLEQRSVDDTELQPQVAAALGLTRAQQDTLDLVVRGLTNREIASVLGISANTVRNRLAECFRLLGASTRTEALFILSRAKP